MVALFQALLAQIKLLLLCCSWRLSLACSLCRYPSDVLPFVWGLSVALLLGDTAARTQLPMGVACWVSVHSFQTHCSLRLCCSLFVQHPGCCGGKNPPVWGREHGANTCQRLTNFCLFASVSLTLGTAVASEKFQHERETG